MTFIRPMMTNEAGHAASLVRANWGETSAERMGEQLYQSCAMSRVWRPEFYTADIGDPLSRDYEPRFGGFIAVQRTMRHAHAIDIIWLAVRDTFKGKGIGRQLVEFSVDKARDAGATSMSVVTEEIKFYNKFGFITGNHLGGNWVEMTAIIKLLEK